MTVLDGVDALIVVKQTSSPVWTCKESLLCVQVITKLLYLICQGESLTKVRL